MSWSKLCLDRELIKDVSSFAFLSLFLVVVLYISQACFFVSVTRSDYQWRTRCLRKWNKNILTTFLFCWPVYKPWTQKRCVCVVLCCVALCAGESIISDAKRGGLLVWLTAYTNSWSVSKQLLFLTVRTHFKLRPPAYSIRNYRSVSKCSNRHQTATTGLPHVYPGSNLWRT